MNRTIARALLQDAFCQVMDNKIFRLLVLAAITLVAPAFLIGFKKDGIDLIFGWKHFEYDEFYGAFGMHVPHVKDVHVSLIQGAQSLIVQGLAGTAGILFCIAATAFFVPRMLERGAADTIFTKPISRPVLLSARYLAGLLFVGTLSFLLVLGIHAGLLLVSGYSDPGFLWSALTLVYVYALVQTVSVLIGVLTRSSVAAILGTLLFFSFNGCIHKIWTAKEWGVSANAERVEGTPTPTAGIEGAKEEKPFLVVLERLLDGMHYALPKTRDADVLVKKLRTVVTGKSIVLQDEGGNLIVDQDPKGFTRSDPSGSLDLLRTSAVWTSKTKDGPPDRISVSRRSRIVERPRAGAKPDEKPRSSKQSSNQAATAFASSLEGQSGVVGEPNRKMASGHRSSWEVVRWSFQGSDGPRAREHAFLAVDDWMYEVDADFRPASEEKASGDVLLDDFLSGVRTREDRAEFMDPDSWYESKFGWSSPLRFNAFFSIGSSFAFALAVLGIAFWRLRRIDF